MKNKSVSFPYKKVAREPKKYDGQCFKVNLYISDVINDSVKTGCDKYYKAYVYNKKEKQEDYDKFKRTSMVAATSYATNAKVGCENELAVFVETKPDLYLPNLSEYVTFSKRDGKNQITLTFDTLLNELQDSILSVEIYYNPYTTELVQNIQKAVLYNIFTQKEV